MKIAKGVPEKTEGFGWKVFRQSAKGKPLRSCLFNVGINLPRRKWIIASINAAHLNSGYHKPAEAGFHIFQSRIDAINYAAGEGRNSWSLLAHVRLVVRKIHYRQAFNHGLGDGSVSRDAPIVVAKEIYIIEANRA